MKIILIRHGMTEGNKSGKYIGCRTDEPLSELGIQLLRKSYYPAVDAIFTSPMFRCKQTAEIIYEGQPYECIDDFKECDFGLFEGLGYTELNGRTDYQNWINSGGTLAFPQGESKDEFKDRCIRAFDLLLCQKLPENISIIAHGGTIMSIMEHYALPHGLYYDFMVPNGNGYIIHEDKSYSLLHPRHS